jgi:hypothetical protein
MESESPGYRWNRIGGAAGLLSMALLIAGLATGPNKPISANAAIAAIVANVSSDSQMIAVSDALNLLALIPFLGYAVICAYGRRAGSARQETPWAPLLAAAATVFAIFAGLDALLETALTFAARQGSLAAEPELTRVFYYLYDGILMPGVAHLALAGYLGLIAVGARVGRVGPRWVAWLAAVFAVMALVNGIVGLTVANGGSSPLAPIAVAGFVLVTIISCVSLLREGRRATTSQDLVVEVSAVS